MGATKTVKTVASPVENWILASLSAEERARLLSSMRTVHLKRKQVLHLAGEPIEAVYFPLTAVLAQVCTLHDGSTIGLGVIARGSMAGVSVLFGVPFSPFEMVVQVAGTARLLPAQRLRDELALHGELERLLFLHLQILLTQVGLGMACASHHLVKGRLATWLLKVRDGTETDRMPITQEVLAQMLGVTRPSVTVHADELQADGLISFHRGIITITDRRGLEVVACECYGLLWDEYERLHGRTPTQRAASIRSGRLSADYLEPT
jgi:CRP-like cAMP-binding protein